jgi:hypothetical protein
MDIITNEEHVKINPYPEYNFILKTIENNIRLWAEYGKHNHVCCKTIYENPNNKDLIVDMGKQIYKTGGMQALVMNYNIIKLFSSYSQITNIEEYFQEVCSEWKI